MIVVIADDLAGAAEMGGMALRHGLTAEVQWAFDPRADVDLIVVDTDTRSCTAQKAASRVGAVAERCRRLGVEWVFKKVDSVLRGQVTAELTALLEACDRRRALLVPANPGLGRVIEHGQYLVAGVPLHETHFAQDPEYPALTSDVLGILGPAGLWSACVLQPGAAMPARGIVVGEATSGADLDAWAAVLDEDTLPAGASEFFGAFLRARGFNPQGQPAPDAVLAGPGTELFVSGSTSSYSQAFCAQCQARGVPVLRMPDGLFGINADSPRLVQKWADQVVVALEDHPRAMVAIDRPICRQPGMPHILSGHLSAVVQQALDRHPVDRLYVEGGGTAVALARRMGWQRLRVRRELATGVVCAHVPGRQRPLVTIKPGSYAWPDEVTAFARPSQDEQRRTL